MAYVVYIYFSFFCGILLYKYHLSFFILLILLISIIFHKNKLFSLTLFIFFISGLLSMHSAYIKSKPYIDKYLLIKRTLKYDYIVSNNYSDFLLKTEYNFFEGDRLYGNFSIKKIEDNNSYTDYLHSKNIFYKVHIITLDSVNHLNNISRFRTILINKNKKNFSKSTAGFINSILFGYKKDINYALKNGFVKAGAIHFLAISGLHTGIIFSFIMLLLFFIPVNIKYKLFIADIILIFYAYLTYLNPPVVRAVIFIIFINISYIIGKEVKWINFVFILAIFLLLFNPFYVYDNGFILSFASIIIISFVNRIKNINFLLKIILISFFITLNISPFLLYKFNYISLLSPISTLLLMPVFILIIPISIISLIWDNNLIIFIIEKLYFIIKWVINYIEKIPLYFKFHIDMYLFIFLTLYLIFIQLKKYKIAFIVSLIIIVYVI